MVFIQVELKHHAQVQDLVGFLLSRSYNNFRVAEQDMFLPGFANFSAMQMTPTMASTMSKDSASSSHAECPILDSQGELDMSPMSFASRLMAQKPICMEILEDDDNDLSIDNPNESGEKAVEKHKLKADVVKSKEKQIVEEIDFPGVRQLQHHISILKRGRVLNPQTQCAMCEKYVATNARCFIKHVGSKHMTIHKYRCAVCQFSSSSRGVLSNHLRRHALDFNTDVESFKNTNLVTLSITKKQCEKIEEMLKACFGVAVSPQAKCVEMKES